MTFPGQGFVMRIRVTQLTDADGTPLDPTVLTDPDTLTVRAGVKGTAGTVLTYGTDPAVVRDGVGLYHVEVTSDSAGEWAAHVETTGPAGAGEKTWTVQASALLLT